MNYYNEIDPYAARWLGNLMLAGHIPLGIIDTRSIEDVTPSDLAGFTQCHFFAGIGVWSYALRRAGWPDGRPVWTGSCPCQPFSAAGAGLGFDDERHLWPTWQWLIEQCRPAVVLGEQVASRDADPWIDLVCDDLEALDYAFGAVPFPSAGVGAPHIRDRLYWVACASGRMGDDDDARLERLRRGHHTALGQRSGAVRPVAEASESCGLADAQRRSAEPGRLDMGAAPRGIESEARERQWLRAESGAGCDALGLANDAGGGWREERQDDGGLAGGNRAEGLAAGLVHGRSDLRPGPVNGLWRDADWLLCRDGKWRPVEPGTFPLAHGAPSRVGRLRAYGNAVTAPAAEAWIRCVMECVP